jgi:hypothetical protein
MKRPIRLLIFLLLGVGGIAGLVFAYTFMRQERDQEATAEAPVMAASRVERGPTGCPVIRLDAATQARLGLRTARLVPGTVMRGLVATARVLDPVPLTVQLDAIQAAETQLTAARRPYERTRRLFEQGQLASAADLDAAEARLHESQAVLDAARHRLAADWGVAFARRKDLTELIRALRAREQALVRVVLPTTASLAAVPVSVRLFGLDGAALASAAVLGPASRVDSLVAGPAFLARVETNADSLMPGRWLSAWISTGDSMSGRVLPRGAVIRHAGGAWVYVQSGTDIFTRRKVTLDQPHPEGWLVEGEWLQPIVIVGAESLFSEEFKGIIQMQD